MTSKVESNPAGTHATVYLANETNSVVQINFSKHCIDGLNSVELQSNGNDSQSFSTSGDISCWTSQSKGSMSAGSYSFNFELGTGDYNTNITSITNPANFYGFVAGSQIGTGNNFDFFVFAGPGILDALINSALSANAQALISALTANKFTFGKLTLALSTCSGLDSITASYAALSQPSDGTYRVTMIFNSGSLDLEGEAGYGSVPLASAVFKTSNLSILIDGMVTVNGATIESATVETLKFSLDSLDISGPIFDINPIFRAILSAATTSMRLVEEILNYTFNGEIINAINNDIKNLLPKTL